MAFEAQVPKTYLHYLTKCSNDNVDKIQSYYSPDSTDISYRIQCKNCKATFDWSHAGVYDKPFGIDIDVLEKFCLSHKHIPVYDAGKSYEASQEFVAKTPDYYACPENGQMLVEYITNTGLDPTSVYSYLLAFAELGDKLKKKPEELGAGVSYSYKFTANLLPSAYKTYVTGTGTGNTISVNSPSDYEISMGAYGSKNHLEPDQLKKIWKWSDFKVDMQVRVYNNQVNAVRLFCNECKQAQELNWYQVQTGSYNIWQTIQEWCEGHKDCGVQEFDRKGRKFKHV